MPNPAAIHLETIAPGRAPGGVWIRVCTLERVLTEYAATVPERDVVDAAAELDGEIVMSSGADRAWIYFYDGDSGECMRTIIVNLRR